MKHRVLRYAILTVLLSVAGLSVYGAVGVIYFAVSILSRPDHGGAMLLFLLNPFMIMFVLVDFMTIIVSTLLLASYRRKYKRPKQQG